MVEEYSSQAHGTVVESIVLRHVSDSWWLGTCTVAFDYKIVMYTVWSQAYVYYNFSSTDTMVDKAKEGRKNHQSRYDASFLEW